jgi:hypothetical protein
MITKIKRGYNGLHRGWPIEYIGHEDLITQQQLQALTELIYRNIQDEDAQEKWFSQINDISSQEAIELIFELETGWR